MDTKSECDVEKCFFRDCKDEEIKRQVNHICDKCIKNKKCEYPEGNYHSPKLESGY